MSTFYRTLLGPAMIAAANRERSSSPPRLMVGRESRPRERHECACARVHSRILRDRVEAAPGGDHVTHPSVRKRGLIRGIGILGYRPLRMGTTGPGRTWRCGKQPGLIALTLVWRGEEVGENEGTIRELDAGHPINCPEPGVLSERAAVELIGGGRLADRTVDRRRAAPNPRSPRCSSLGPRR